MIWSFIILAIAVVLGSLVIYLWEAKAFAGPLLGAIVATGVTLSVNHYFKSQDAKKSKSDFIAALIAEITALSDLIISNKEQYEKNNGTLINFHITEDYFAVFSENANKLGMLPEKEAAQVIRTYMETKGLFDTVRSYSRDSREILNIDRILVRLQAAGMQQTPEYTGLYADFNQQVGISSTCSDEIMKESIPRTLQLLNDVKTKLIKLKS